MNTAAACLALATLAKSLTQVTRGLRNDHVPSDSIPIFHGLTLVMYADPTTHEQTIAFHLADAPPMKSRLDTGSGHARLALEKRLAPLRDQALILHTALAPAYAAVPPHPYREFVLTCRLSKTSAPVYTFSFTDTEWSEHVSLYALKKTFAQRLAFFAPFSGEDRSVRWIVEGKPVQAQTPEGALGASALTLPGFRLPLLERLGHTPLRLALDLDMTAVHRQFLARLSEDEHA
jgi:hypothetical protein